MSTYTTLDVGHRRKNVPNVNMTIYKKSKKKPSYQEHINIFQFQINQFKLYTLNSESSSLYSLFQRLHVETDLQICKNSSENVSIL